MRIFLNSILFLVLIFGISYAQDKDSKEACVQNLEVTGQYASLLKESREVQEQELARLRNRINELNKQVAELMMQGIKKK